MMMSRSSVCLTAALLLSSIASNHHQALAFFVPLSTSSSSYSSSSFRPLSASTLEPPVRTPETQDRVQQVRDRFRKASEDAAEAKGCVTADTGDEWWRTPVGDGAPREINNGDNRPLRVVIAGGGVAGLVSAAACHAKGMQVAIFEQASQVRACVRVDCSG